jgi:hypothetical protein
MICPETLTIRESAPGMIKYLSDVDRSQLGIIIILQVLDLRKGGGSVGTVGGECLYVGCDWSRVSLSPFTEEVASETETIFPTPGFHETAATVLLCPLNTPSLNPLLCFR